MEYGAQAGWLFVITLGAVVLAAAMIYGSMGNRRRTMAERVTTEIGTKRDYQREDRDHT